MPSAVASDSETAKSARAGWVRGVVPITGSRSGMRSIGWDTQTVVLAKGLFGRSTWRCRVLRVLSSGAAAVSRTESRHSSAWVGRLSGPERLSE